MKYKVGEVVICIKENSVEEYVGTSWIVTDVAGRGLYYVKAVQNENENFIFREDEISIASSLLKALF